MPAVFLLSYIADELMILFHIYQYGVHVSYVLQKW